MLIFLAVVFVVFTTHKLTTAQQAGCSGPPSSTQVATLIASNLNGPQGSAIITLQMSPAGFTFRVVCLSSSGIRNQYRFASIVAYYSENEGTPQYGQFEFECVSSVWSATGNLLDAAIFNRVVPLAENSSAINATNRTDCAYCLNRVSPSLPRFTDTVNHCSACSGCAQPLCYITDTSLPSSGSNFTSVCCNYYMSDGITCTTACPPSSYPDGNRTCVPCPLGCQNGGVPRSDTCGCNCSGSVVYGGTNCTTCLCQNGGTCGGSVCTCPPGYMGTLCEIFSPITSPAISNIAAYPEGASFYVMILGLVVCTIGVAVCGIASAISLAHYFKIRRRYIHVKKMKALTYNINTLQSIELEQTETPVATVLLGSSQASCTLRRDIYDVPYDKPNSNSSKGEERSLQALIIQDQSRLPENYVNLEQLTPKVGNADNSQSNVSPQSKSGLKPANLILPQDFRCNNGCPPEIKDLTCKVDPPLIRAGVTEETSSNDVSAEINLCADHEHGDMDRSFGSDYALYDDTYPPKSNSSEVTGHMDPSDDFHRGPLQAGLKGSSVGVHPTESEYEVCGLYQGLMCVEHNYLALYNIPCKKWSKENLQTLGVSSKTKKLPPRLLKVRTPNQNEIESRAKVIREDLKVTDTCTMASN